MALNEPIIWPMIAQAGVTIGMYVHLGRSRVALVKAGQAKASDYHTNATETPESRVLTNSVANQFELPVLFFACCLAWAATGLEGWLMPLLAWGFVVAKTVHSAVQLSARKLMRRRLTFMVALGVQATMWVWLAVRLLLD